MPLRREAELGAPSLESICLKWIRSRGNRQEYFHLRIIFLNEKGGPGIPGPPSQHVTGVIY